MAVCHLVSVYKLIHLSYLLGIIEKLVKQWVTLYLAETIKLKS